MIFAFYEARAGDPPVSLVHRSLACGSITVSADTLLSSPNDDPDVQGLRQTIRLTDVSKQRSFNLPLFQHWSKNERLHGQKVLDGLIWGFQCATTKFNETYIILFWSCKNPDAKSCEESMSIRDEWTAAYDKCGNHLPADPTNMTKVDEERIKRLGLWPFFERPDLDRTGGFTYFYDQVAPNGHIR
jgi:hypothetical protein